jgi:hypothetical protein
MAENDKLSSSGQENPEPLGPTASTVPAPLKIKRRVPNKIAALPESLRLELDRNLSDGSVLSCRALSKWLEEKGFEISHAAIHKYGQNFERKLAAVRIASEQAREVCEQFKDEGEDRIQEALMRLVQSQLFQMLVAANQTSKRKTSGSAKDLVPVNLPALARSVAGLVKIDFERRRFGERTRAKIAQAAETIDAAAKSDGLSGDVVARIKGVLMAIEE